MTSHSNQPKSLLPIILTFAALFMLGAAFASVPLYRMFCQTTGFGGTPQVATEASGIVTERLLTVRFNADTHRDLPWHFKPLEISQTIKVGANALTFYESKNLSDTPIIGMATYNITPPKAGVYFNKIACFCFEEQLLKPGEYVEMPVTYFIDPEFAEDPNMDDVDTITLSYTFFRFTP